MIKISSGKKLGEIFINYYSPRLLLCTYDQMHDGEKDFPKSHLNVNEQNLFFCHNEEELDKKY
jgi:hypothetical protein